MPDLHQNSITMMSWLQAGLRQAGPFPYPEQLQAVLDKAPPMAPTARSRLQAAIPSTSQSGLILPCSGICDNTDPLGDSDLHAAPVHLAMYLAEQQGRHPANTNSVAADGMQVAPWLADTVCWPRIS